MAVAFVLSFFCLWVTCHSKHNHKEICHMKYKYQGEELQSKLFWKTVTLFYQKLFLRAFITIQYNRLLFSITIENRQSVTKTSGGRVQTNSLIKTNVRSDQIWM